MFQHIFSYNLIPVSYTYNLNLLIRFKWNNNLVVWINCSRYRQWNASSIKLLHMFHLQQSNCFTIVSVRILCMNIYVAICNILDTQNTIYSPFNREHECWNVNHNLGLNNWYLWILCAELIYGNSKYVFTELYYSIFHCSSYSNYPILMWYSAQRTLWCVVNGRQWFSFKTRVIRS